MKNGKTPGEDGLPVDFYKVFWSRFGDLFYGMVLEVFQQEMLHATARKGILNLIPKANKDTRLIKNLRPITLLNTDYKIIEKSIANMMLPALEHIINKDQRGFMKERRISVNIRKMLDIMHYTEKEDLEAVVLSLDFVKCFDKCSFSILHGSLDYFGFGEIVKAWTYILYRDFSVIIQNNGNFSDSIPIKKGVHQGGCCSSVYFLVIAEILALTLRSNEDIHGITIQDIKNILNQFADDMDIFSLNREKSIKAIFEELDKFKWQSGFTVSYEKTTVYRIGSLQHSDAELYNLSQYAWSNKDITVLGVTISHEDVVSTNYDQIIPKIKKILYAWQNRGLSLIGKVQVVNTLIASLFVYKMMILPMIPINLVKNIDNVIREFLWNGRKSKISYRILQNPKSEGGLNLVNFRNKEKSLKATWPLILHTELQYLCIVYKIMRVSEIKDLIWQCSLLGSDVTSLGMSSSFWVNVLISWAEYNYYNNFRIENQIIWYNSKIRVRDKPVLWRDVYKAGLVFVYQLFENQEFKSFSRIQEEYGLSAMRYNSLKSAVPKDWTRYFLATPIKCFSPLPPNNYQMLVAKSEKHFSQTVYRFLSEDITLTHSKYIGWRRELGAEMDETLYDFRYLHLDIYRITNIAKYRSFQYRLVQRGLVTNIQMFKWGLIESNICSFCGQSEETLTHLFYYCNKVQVLWKAVIKYIKEISPCEDIQFTPKAVIF